MFFPTKMYSDISTYMWYLSYRIGKFQTTHDFIFPMPDVSSVFFLKHSLIDIFEKCGNEENRNCNIHSNLFNESLKIPTLEIGCEI